MRATQEKTRTLRVPSRERAGSLSDQVAAELGRRIVSGVYNPGDTLPTEPMVQEEFQVSRTAVREAVRLLSAKGLTISRPKIGTKVRPRNDWNMLDPDVLHWQIDQRPSAGERATPEEIEQLGQAFAGIKDRARGSADQIRDDLAFHMIVLEASHNPMLRSVGGLIESGLVISFSLGWRTVMGDDAVVQHRDVYEAIRDRNADEAFLAMRRLLRNAKGNVFDSIWVGRNADSQGETSHS
jgi:GntR family galactonate operon transcriptional repressor